MNQFYNYLLQRLMAFGYEALDKEYQLLLKKDRGDEILLLEIVPEVLPGQDPINYRAISSYMDQVATKQMILSGKPVETIIVSMNHGKPSGKVISEITDLKNVWIQDIDSGRIFIYENQISDFYGLEEALTDIVNGWSLKETNNRRRVIKNTLTPVNIAIILANILVFIVLSFLGDVNSAGFAANHGGAVYEYIVYFKEYYRLFTSTFYHFSLQHLFGNMLFLLLMGSILERNMGSVSYAIIYFGSGFIAAITSLFTTLAAEPYVVSGGASGAVFGVMGGLMALVLYHLLIKRRRSFEGMSFREMIFMVVLAIGYGFTSGGDVDNAAHIGGFIAGLILTSIFIIVKEIIKKRKYA